MKSKNGLMAKGLSSTQGSGKFGSMKKVTSNVKKNTVGKIKTVKVKKMK